MGNGNFRTFRGYQLEKQDRMLLTPSMEDYLEMIYRIHLEEGYVRINQLAEKLNVRASSATRTVQRLAERGLVDYEKYEVIQLTKRGERVGEFLLKRHLLVQEFLENIGVKDTILKDTEMIEHNISDSALQAIKIFNNFLNDNPDILQKYVDYRKRAQQKDT
ncbi:MAG: iron dependent repressor, metal binding and dimerization domain protein [Limnochordia bacterium]|nr:MarR family transcriptional regulator [Limnochordia bacterium]MDD2630081.1 iron dependent repressor, metal binding and dimerization domain protein [Limnochordia bacterium]MDD4517849.1 iron dependent repressor, metal binding and dimerization domain protein [Limnochordia bacterium]